MNYVYDSSFIGALIITDEKSSMVENTHAAIDEDEQIYTSQLLWYEITNVFKNLLRRKRYTYDEVEQFARLLHVIKLTTDFETGPHYTQKLLRLCNDYNLSSYDAAYLELAERKNAVLCTLDEGLLAAAEKHGVAIIK